MLLSLLGDYGRDAPVLPRQLSENDGVSADGELMILIENTRNLVRSFIHAGIVSAWLATSDVNFSYF